MKPFPAQPNDRERFLAAVAEQVPVERVVELYLFQPLRQGGVESGVAVIAAATDAMVPEAEGRPGDTPPRLDPAIDSGPALPDSRDSDGVPLEAQPAEPRDQHEAQADGFEPRYTVFTAHYRHVLKGPERGRWEVSVVAEADAPLATVGAVVRGVQRRAGDVDPPEHITGDALRDALAGGPAAQS
jgi:hypothetical protein